MSDDTLLSPLRWVLCSHANACRVAAWMTADGLPVQIVATGEPMQPWRIFEAFAAEERETRACG